MITPPIKKGFEFAPVEDVCLKISSGGTPSRLHPEFFTYENSGHLWVKSKELLDRSINDTEEKITDEGLKQSSARYYPENSILLAMYGANVCQLGWLKIPATINQAICGMIVNELLADSRFIFFAFLSTRDQLSFQARGAAQQNLNLDLIRSFKIPLPPLATQRKIAAILSAYDNLIENNTQRIKILEKIAQVIYHEWFVKNSQEDNSSIISLNDICHKITDGKHGDCQDEEDSGYYFISCKDVKEGLINYYDARQITEKDFLETHNRTQLQHDDIVITNSGTIGRMALVPNTKKVRRTTFQKSVAIVKPNKEKVLPNWLFFYLQFNKETLIEWAGGTAQKNLLLRDLRAFKVLLPPFSSISRFEQAIQPIRYMIELLHEKNANLRRTRDLLLPKLISGELDVSGNDIDIPADL
jgi:type I restriction enzyme S subunit